MDYHSFLQAQKDQIINDECLLSGTCSPSPLVAFSHELIISYLQELSFYLLKLKELGITNEQIKEDIINIISSIILNIEYEQPQLFEIINKIYADLHQAKELYISVCKRNELKKFIVKSKLKNPQMLAFSEAIATGQKIFKNKYEKLNSEQLNVLDLIMNVSKSLARHLIELKGLDSDDEEAYEAILHLLSFRRFHSDFEERSIKLLIKFSILDHNIFMKLWKLKEERYGKLTSANISFSTRKNKAILVSGSNLKDLEMILEATKNRNIDIYTHGQLFYAHGYPKINKYPNLAGHFGRTESSLVDFAQFPGAVFMTRNSLENAQSLYRSNIFTTNLVAPKGVIKIKNYNFEPIIEAALKAKGFTSTQEKNVVKINVNETEIIKKINSALDDLKQNKIRNIILIGISNYSKKQKEYFNDFLKLLDNSNFVLSFSYSNKKSNMLLVESEFGFPMLFRYLSEIADNTNLSKLRITIMFAKLESYTLSTIIYLKSVGIKTIYLEDASANQINPSVINTFRKIFNINKYSTPENDLQVINKPVDMD